MFFKFKKKISNKSFCEPKIFHLPPTSDFARCFVDGFISKFEPKILDTNPELVGHVTLLVSNKNLAKNIEEILVSYGLVILPKIIELEKLSEIFYEQVIKKNINKESQIHYRVISNLDRFLLLHDILQELEEQGFQKISKTNLFDLAHSLTSLVDELAINNLGSKHLKKLNDDELPEHLQLNLRLLQRVLNSYEKVIRKEKLIDEHSKYSIEVNELVNSWRLKLHSKPIVLVGSTGSIPSTAKLMQAVSHLPQGFVVLPGLDPYLTFRAWNSLSPDHPQYGFYALCKTWGFKGRDQYKIFRAPSWQDINTNNDHYNIIRARTHLLSLLMRPGPVTDEWRSEGKLITTDLPLALNSISLIEAENSRQEAAAISVCIKEAVNEGVKVALVTPSKLLVRRVSAELKRWNINPNNSFGKCLASTSFGIFFRQAALVLDKSFDLDVVISLLKNCFCGGSDQQHDLNVIKIQEMFAKSNKLFFELRDEDWFLNQDEEFIGWFNWLIDVFQEVSSMGKINCLTEFFSYHKKFLHRLMLGYQPKKDRVRLIEDIITELSTSKIDEYDQVFNLIEKQLSFSSRLRKFEFWVYRKIVDNLLTENLYQSISENKTATVFIWGTLESRTQNADIFILAGLNEGTWPSYYNEDLWLNRSTRAILGIDLLERKIGLSAHDFQQGFMAKTLILSRSLKDNNIPQIASRWLVRLENLLGGLGTEGQTCLDDIKARGKTFSKLSSELFSSKILIEDLNPELRHSAIQPAPVPPLSSRPNKLSVTDIETFIRNPYAIYAKRVLNLKKIENIKNSADLRNKGSLLHATLASFIAKYTDFLPKQNEAGKFLKNKFDSFLKTANIPVEVKSLWKSQFDIKIKGIVSLEKERRLKGKPYRLEVSGKLSVKLNTNETFLVTARADRIDRGNEGFIIYDYKTGKVSQAMLEKFSPQLDIEALILKKGSFGKIINNESVELSLIGLGNEPQQYNKTVTIKNFDQWEIGLTKIIEHMKSSPFVAQAEYSEQNIFFDDYYHLSRFGEWNDKEE